MTVTGLSVFYMGFSVILFSEWPGQVAAMVGIPCDLCVTCDAALLGLGCSLCRMAPQTFPSAGPLDLNLELETGLPALTLNHEQSWPCCGPWREMGFMVDHRGTHFPLSFGIRICLS